MIVNFLLYVVWIEFSGLNLVDTVATPVHRILRLYSCTVLLGLITQWIPTVDPCVLVKVGLLIPTVG